MSRLPLPNWNLPPISNQNGCFTAVSSYGYGCLPYMQQQPHNDSMAYMYTTPHQTPVPRPSFSQGYIGSKPQSDDQSKSNVCSQLTTAEFSCDVCERLFKTRQILETHLQSHVKCDHEGCSFQASRKMMKLHFIQNHAEGRMKIKLDTPAEIGKWREQRRKNYPTAAIMKKKLEEAKAKRESGQVAKTQNFRYTGNRRKIRPRYNQQQQPKYQKQSLTQNPCENHNNCSSNRKGSGLPKDEAKKIEGDPLSVLIADNKSDSDNEMVEPSDAVPSLVQPPPVMTNTNALMALCASYGGDSSSDENDTDASKEVNNNAKVIHLPEQDLPVKMTTTQESSSPKKTRKRKQECRKNGTHHPKKVTLLEKLLAPQIRHENNVMLQCLRYIVENDYFGATQDNTV